MDEKESIRAIFSKYADEELGEADLEEIEANLMLLIEELAGVRSMTAALGLEEDAMEVDDRTT